MSNTPKVDRIQEELEEGKLSKILSVNRVDQNIHKANEEQWKVETEDLDQVSKEPDHPLTLIMKTTPKEPNESSDEKAIVSIG